MGITTKTKKIRKKIDKKAIWESFENENPPNIECIYSKSSREFCDICEGNLLTSEEGFSTCQSCGVIYKDYLDQGAEWRFYGNEDNYISDPTRAGPPINPLLKESSFGCKVICPNR